MRAYDMALMLALFGAVMGVLDSTLIWDGGTINTGPQVINQTTFDQLDTIENPTSLGVLGELAAFGWAALKLLFNMLHSIVHIAPVITSVFGGGTDAKAVAYIIQVGIWLTYLIALFQAKTGKSIKGMV